MLTLAGLLTITIATMSALAQAQQRQRTPRVLVYTATAGFRHDSIPTAIEVLGGLSGNAGVNFVFSENPGLFTDTGLAGFDCLMFVHNSDQILNSTGEAALQNYFRSGGAYVGVHAASTCLVNNTNYQQAVGAIFDYHPELQPATFTRVNSTHPATVNVPDQWRYTEEVYYFRSDPRSNGAQLLLSVDESSYTNTGTTTGSYPSQGNPHPIAWFIESPQSAQPLKSGASKAGRSFYTSLGHSIETWRDPTFQSHVMGGLRWALDGASTRAYGAGLVGNNTSSASGTSQPGPVSASASASASGGSSTAQPTSSASGTGTSAAAPSQSRAAGDGRIGRPGAGAAAVVIAAGGLGLGLVL